MKDGFIENLAEKTIQLNQLMKTLGIQALSLQKEVSIQLNHPQLMRLESKPSEKGKVLKIKEPSPVNQVSPN